MKTKLHLRRFNSFLLKTGIVKPKKPSNHSRFIDARNEDSLDKIVISTLNHNKKNQPNNKTFETENNTPKSPYQIYQEFREKALRSKENLSETEFLKSFTNRIELLDREIKLSPFQKKSVRVEDKTVEYIYKHLLSQIYKSRPEEYKNNPVLLFKRIQNTILSTLESMERELDTIDGVFKLHKFLDFVSKEITETVTATKTIVGMGFVHHMTFQEVSEYKFY